MSYSGSSENIGLTKVKNPDEIGIVLTFDSNITPSSFKDFLICAIKPTVDSKDLLQRKTITESEFAQLSDPTLAPTGGAEESKDDAIDSKDDDTIDPPPPKKEREVIRFFVKKDFMNTLQKATIKALEGMTLNDEGGLKSSINQLMKAVAFNLFQGRNQTKLQSDENSQNAIARAFTFAQSQVTKNGGAMVTFVLHPNWYAARTESKWDTHDIRCITANKDLEIKPETKQSSFSPTDVGGGLNASKNKRTFVEFSHKLVTTIQNAATDTV